MKNLLEKSILKSLVFGLFILSFLFFNPELNKADTMLVTTSSVPTISWNTVTTSSVPTISWNTVTTSASVYSPATIGWANSLLSPVFTPVYASPALFNYSSIGPVLPLLVY